MTELTDKTAVSDPPMFEEVSFVDEDNDLERAFDRAFLAMATPAPPGLPTMPPIPAPPPVRLDPSAFDDILKGEILVPDRPRVASGSKPRVDPKMWGDAPARAAVPPRPTTSTNRRAPRKSAPYQSIFRADAQLARDDSSIRSSVYRKSAPALETEPVELVAAESSSPVPSDAVWQAEPAVIIAEASSPVRVEVLAEAKPYAPLHLDPLPPDVELAEDPLDAMKTLMPTPLTRILPEVAREPEPSASGSWPAEKTSLAPGRSSNAPVALAPELAPASLQAIMPAASESWPAEQTSLAGESASWQAQPAAVSPEDESWWQDELAAAQGEPTPDAPALEAPPQDAASSWQEAAALEPPPAASQLDELSAWQPALEEAVSETSPASRDSASWTTPVELASPSDVPATDLPSEIHGEIQQAYEPPVDSGPDVAAAFAATLPANDFAQADVAQLRGEIEPELPAFTPPAPAVEAPAEQPAADAAPPKIGEVITVFGCRGGCGATTIAVNLAGSLAAAGKEVCIVDLDVQLGDVLVTLDLDSNEAASLVNLAREVHNLDPDALKRRLARHDSGVYVLAQGGRLEEIDDTLPSKIPALLAMLARHFDAIIIDGVDDFSELALSAIDAANVIALVVTQDVLAVRRGRRVIDICRQLEVPDYKVKPVINCYRKRARVDRDSVSAGLSVPVAATVVEDERTTKRSQTAGQLLHEMARRKGVTKDIAALQALASSQRAVQPAPVEAEEPAADPMAELAGDARS